MNINSVSLTPNGNLIWRTDEGSFSCECLGGAYARAIKEFIEDKDALIRKRDETIDTWCGRAREAAEKPGEGRSRPLLKDQPVMALRQFNSLDNYIVARIVQHGRPLKSDHWGMCCVEARDMLVGDDHE